MMVRLAPLLGGLSPVSERPVGCLVRPGGVPAGQPVDQPL